MLYVSYMPQDMCCYMCCYMCHIYIRICAVICVIYTTWYVLLYVLYISQDMCCYMCHTVYAMDMCWCFCHACGAQHSVAHEQTNKQTNKQTLDAAGSSLLLCHLWSLLSHRTLPPIFEVGGQRHVEDRDHTFNTDRDVPHSTLNTHTHTAPNLLFTVQLLVQSPERH